MMRVLSYDPGKSTGWCILEGTNTEQKLIAAGEIPDWHGVKDTINKFQPDVIVFETFQLYAWKAQSLSWNTFLPCEVIGVIKFIAEELDIPCIGQGPAQRVFFTDDRLKACGITSPSKHAKDAIRHGMYFLRFGKDKIAPGG